VFRRHSTSDAAWQPRQWSAIVRSASMVFYPVGGSRRHRRRCGDVGNRTVHRPSRLAKLYRQVTFKARTRSRHALFAHDGRRALEIGNGELSHDVVEQLHVAARVFEKRTHLLRGA
jgi:hypothetical protein